MSENVLVTGGAGFIGSHLVDALLEQGHNVRVIDSLDPQVHGSLLEESRWPSYCNLEAEYVLGDVRDRAALRQVLQDVDVVFHQAASVGVGQSMYQIERYMDVNSQGTAVLLDLIANDSALRDRIRKFVVASSMSIYGEGTYECPEHGIVFPRLRSQEQLIEHDWELACPIGLAAAHARGASAFYTGSYVENYRSACSCSQPLEPVITDESKPLFPTSIYAISKKNQEEMSLTVGYSYKLPTVALRYFNVYGPRQALSNPYTGVVANFAARLVNGRLPIIFEDGLQSRDFVFVSDVVQANLLAMQRDDMDFNVFNVGSGRSISILELAEVLAEQLGVRADPNITQMFRFGDIRHCVADITQIQAHGYAPSILFEDGVASLVDWICTQNAFDAYEQAHMELVERGLCSDPQKLVLRQFLWSMAMSGPSVRLTGYETLYDSPRPSVL